MLPNTPFKGFVNEIYKKKTTRRCSTPNSILAPQAVISIRPTSTLFNSFPHPVALASISAEKFERDENNCRLAALSKMENFNQHNLPPPLILQSCVHNYDHLDHVTVHQLTVLYKYVNVISTQVTIDVTIIGSKPSN